MEGRPNNNERPIAKPSYPLPAVFQPSRQSELPTRRKDKAGDKPRERAHFYRKRTTDTDTPVYDFFITTERENPGTKRQQDLS